MGSDRTRSVLGVVLLVLGTLILVVGSLTLWVKRQAVDTDAWVDASSRMLENQDVREALSVYLVDQLYTSGNVENRLEQRLPDNLDGIAAPLAGVLRRPAEEAVVRFLERPRVQVLWENVNRAAHQTLLRVLEDETRAGVSTSEGTVTLDLRSFVIQVGEQLGFGEQLEARLPADAGQITILQSDQLEGAQTALKTLKALSWLVLILALAAFGGAVWLAGDRRSTLRTIGIILLVVGVVLLLIRRAAGSYLIDALADGEVVRNAAGASWLIGTSLLAQTAWALLVAGLVIILGAVLVGPSRLAGRARSAVGPTLRDRPGTAWAALGAVYLLLVLWGPVPALRNLPGILILGALLALGFEAVRRETVGELDAESPNAAELPPAPSQPPSIGASP
jgi:hypothetical protein